MKSESTLKTLLLHRASAADTIERVRQRHPDVFQVLGDPTRRRLVAALRGGERSVNELVLEVPIGQPGVSRQLATLKTAGFVRVRPDGRRRLYSLTATPFRELDEWMYSYQEVWDRRLDRLGEELQRRHGADHRGDDREGAQR